MKSTEQGWFPGLQPDTWWRPSKDGISLVHPLGGDPLCFQLQLALEGSATLQEPLWGDL